MLVWWGHAAHGEVADDVVERVHRHVLSGMGLVVLHSGHWSKIFGKLMGTTCTLRWRSEQDRELVWTVNPTHPIAEGVPNPIIIDAQEMYGESFDIPAPDELIFISSFSGGEVFRSGCTFRRGHGKIFFFSPGDQDYPVYHHPDVRRVIANGVPGPRATGRGRCRPCCATRPTTSSTATATPVRSRPTTTSRLMPSPSEPDQVVQVGAGAMGRPGSTSSPARRTWSSSVWSTSTCRRRSCSAPVRACPTWRSPRSLPELLDWVAADAVINVTVPEAHQRSPPPRCCTGCRCCARSPSPTPWPQHCP